MDKLGKLRASIRAFEVPETGIKIVNGIINGTGFFPAADGMIGANRSLENRSIMFLGQDQDSVENFKETEEKDHEDYSPTWKNLKKLFIEIHDLELTEQENMIKTSFMNWKNEQEQIDDVSILGIKV